MFYVHAGTLKFNSPSNVSYINYILCALFVLQVYRYNEHMNFRLGNELVTIRSAEKIIEKDWNTVSYDLIKINS